MAAGPAEAKIHINKLLVRLEHNHTHPNMPESPCELYRFKAMSKIRLSEDYNIMQILNRGKRKLFGSFMQISYGVVKTSCPQPPSPSIVHHPSPQNTHPRAYVHTYMSRCFPYIRITAVYSSTK